MYLDESCTVSFYSDRSRQAGAVSHKHARASNHNFLKYYQHPQHHFIVYRLKKYSAMKTTDCIEKMAIQSYGHPI